MSVTVTNKKNLIDASELLRHLRNALTVGLFLASGLSAHATSETWSATSNGNWSTTTNWNAGAGPAPGSITSTTNTDIATFNTTTGVTVTIDQTSQDIGGLTFSGSTTGAFIIGGSGANAGNALLLSSGGQILDSITDSSATAETINAPLVLEPATSSTAGTYSFTNNASLVDLLNFAGNISGGTTSSTETLTLNGTNTGANTISGIISNGNATGGVLVTVNGTGTWVLGGANTYTGATTISSGILRLTNTSAVQSSAVALNGGTLDLRANTTAAGTFATGGVTLGGNATINVDNLNGSATNQTVTLGGTFSIAGTDTLNVTSASGYTLALGTVNSTATINAPTQTFNALGSNVSLTTYTSSGSSGYTTLVLGGTGNYTIGSLESGAVQRNLNPTINTSGTVTLNGSTQSTINLNSFTSANNNVFVTMNNGTLLLDFSNLATPTNLINQSGSHGTTSFAFGGGTLDINGKSGSTATSQDAISGGTTFNSGASAVIVKNNGSTTTTLKLEGITRNVGGTVDFSSPSGTTFGTNGLVTTTNTTNVGGILGGYATVNGSTWAVAPASSGGNITGLATGSYTNTGTTALSAAGTTANIDVAATGTNASSASQVVNSLRFNDSTGAATVDATNGLTLTTGGILVTSNVGNNLSSISNGTLKGASGADLIVIQNNTSNGLTIGSTIADNSTATALTKSGAGLLTLSNTTNAYTGLTYLNGGTLNIAADASLGMAPGSAVANQLTISGGTLQLANSFNLASNRGITLAVKGGTIDTNSFNTTYGGIIAGSGALTKTGAGTLTLSVANTYTGNTTIQAGTIVIGNNSALGTGTVTIGNSTGSSNASLLTGGAYTIGYGVTVAAGTSGTLTLGGNTANSSGASGLTTLDNNLTYSQVSGGTFSLTGNITSGATGTQTVTFNNAGSISQSTGVVGGGTGTISVVQSGAGTTTLSGANLYTGGTTINAGTIVIGNATGLGSIASDGLTFGASSTGALSLNGNSITLTDLNTNVTAGSPVIQDNNSTAVTLTINTANSDTYAGVLQNGSSGTLALTKAGAGTQTLSGANTYTGATTINAGSLTAASTTALGNNSAVTLANVASADLNLSSNVSIGSLSGGGATGGNVTLGGNTLKVGGSNTSTTFAGVISGTSGSLTKTGTGTLTLTGANTYGGGSTISTGQVVAGVSNVGSTSGALGTGTITLGDANTGAGGSPTLVIAAAGTTVSNNITMANVTANGFGLVGNNSSGTVTFSGNITLTTNTLDILAATGGTTDFNTGTWTTGSNGFTVGGVGGYAGTVELDNSLTAGGAVTVAGGTLDIGPGANLTANAGLNVAAGSIANSNSSSTITGNVNYTSATGSTFGGVIAGSGATLTMNSSGVTLTLGGANTFTGGTALNAGTLLLTNANALQDSVVTISTGTGTTGTNDALEFNSGLGSATIGALSGTNSEALLDTGGSAVSLTVGNNNASGTYSGVLSGAGSLTMESGSTGTQTLVTSTNTFSGGLNINGGTVSVAANTSLGGASGTAGAISLNGGTLQSTASGRLIDTHVITVGTNGGTINNLATGTAGTAGLEIGTTNTFLSSSSSSVLTVTGNGSLNTGGTGALWVAAPNTYGGNITIQNGGLFEYGLANAVGSGATFTIGNNGELALDSGLTLANSITVSGGTNSEIGFNNGASTYSGNITLNTNATVVLQNWYNSTVESGTISGSGTTSIIQGTGALTVNSGTGTGGTLTLSNGNNNYSGGTTVTGSSILSLSASTTGSAGSVTKGPAGTGTITLNNGTLAFGASNLTIANALNLATSTTNTLGANNTNSANLSGALTGSGTLVNFNSGVASGVTINFTGDLSGFTGTLNYTDSNTTSTDKWRFTSQNLSNATLNLNVGTGTGSNNGDVGFADSTTGATLQVGALTGNGVFQGSNLGGLDTLQLGNSSNSTFSGVIGVATGNQANIAVTKVGSGTVTLSGANLYTGATTVSAGTLALGSGGTINSSSAITITNGADFIQTNTSTAVTPTVTVKNGILDGTGTVNTVSVSTGTNNIVTNSAGLATPSQGYTLTIGNLTFSGTGTASPIMTGLAGTSASTAGINVTGTLTFTGSNKITINASDASWANNTTYDLIGFGGSTSNVTLSDLTRGTITGLTGRQGATLGVTGGAGAAGDITLAISGDSPQWIGGTAAGGDGATWTTDATQTNAGAGANNWATVIGQTATSFWAADDAQFNDTYNLGSGNVAVGSGAVNIAGGNVSPTSVTFNNSSVNYTISSTGGFGIASGIVVKNGTAKVTVSTANSYTGSTTINAGAYNLQNSAALGASSGVTVASGAVLQLQGSGTTSNAVPLTLSGAGLTASPSGALDSISGNNTYTGLVKLGASATINSDTVGNTLALSNTGTMTGSGFNLTLAGAGNGSIAEVIGTGAGSLTMNSTGTWTLSGANTYTGGTTINSGTIIAGSSTALGASTSALAFGTSSNGTLITNGKSLTVSSLNGDSTAAIRNANATAAMFTDNTTGTDTFAGNITDGAGGGSLALTKSATGSLTLSGTNTYSGSTTLSGGTLQFSGSSAMSSNSALSLASGTTLNLLSDTGATFSNAGIAAFATGTYNINVNAINSPAGNGNTLILTGENGSGSQGSYQVNVTSTTSDTLQFGTTGNAFQLNNGTTTFNLTGANVILSGLSDSQSGSNDGIAVQGNSTLTVNGTVSVNSSRSVTATVNSGTLTLAVTGDTIGNGGSHNSAYNVVLNGGTLNVNTASSLSGYNNSTFTIAGGTLDNTSGAALTVAAVNSGFGGTTAPPVILNGDFTFGGTNSLNLGAGAVSLGTVAGATRTITTAGSGTLTLDGVISNGTNVTTPTINLTEAGTGTLTLSGNNTFGTNGGTVTVNGGSTLNLNGSNAYTGSTLVNNGNLNIGSSGSLTGSTTLTVASSGTLSVASGGSILATSNLTDNGTTTFNEATPTVATLNGTNTGAFLTLNANTLTVTGGGSFAGVIQDSSTGGGLTVSGSTLTLSGANTYGGTTTISSGSLVLGSGGSLYSGLNPGGQVAVTGSFDMSGSGAAQAIGDLTGSGTVNLGSYILTLNDSSAQTFSGAIQGVGGGLALTGGGSLTLSGTDTFSGTTSVSNGLVIYASSAAFGNSPIVVSSGSAVQVQGSINGGSSASLSLAGNGQNIGANGALENVSGANTFAGPVTLASAAGSGNLIYSDSGSSLTLSGGLTNNGFLLTVGGPGNTSITGITGSGSGGLTKSGAGNLTLSGTVSYNGATSIQGGTITAGSITALGNNSAYTLSNTSGVLLNLNGFNNSIGSLSGGGAIGGNVALGSNTLTTGGLNTSTTFSGVISGSGGGLTKTGSGNQTLSGTNTYTGATTINGGTITAGSIQALGSNSAVSLANTSGVTLNLNSFNNTVGSLSGGGASGGNVKLGSATLTTGGLGTSTTYSGVISGTGALTKAGTGAMTLSGLSTYSGGTTISAGSLVAAVSNSGSTSGAFGPSADAVTLGNAATTTNNSAVALLNGGFTVSNPITVSANATSGGYTIGGSNTTGTATYTGNITLNQPVSLIAATGGTTDFGSTVTWTTNNNAFTIGSSGNAGTVEIDSALADSGGIAINNGTLVLDSAFTLGNITVASGATLSGTGSVAGTTTVNGGTVTGSGLTLTGTTTFSSGGNTLQGTETVTGGVSITGSATVSQPSGTLTGSVSDTSSGSSTFSGVIAGSGSTVTLNNASGFLTLAGSNTYTGATSVNQGTLAFVTGNVSAGGAQSLGENASLNLGVASTSSGTLQYIGTGAATLAKSVNALGNGNDTIQNSGTGLLTLTGGLVKNGTKLTLEGGSNGINVTTSAISGSSSGSDLLVTGGTTTISVASTYNGPTTVYGNGTLVNGVNDALPDTNTAGVTTSTTLNLGSSSLESSSYTNIYNLNGYSQILAGLTSTNGSSGTDTNSVVGGTGNGATHLSSLTLTPAGLDSFSGVIGGSGSNQNNVAVNMAGTGTLTLSGANTYTGGTTLSAGTVVAGIADSGSGSSATSGALGSGSGAVTFTGGTLQYTSASAGTDYSSRIKNSTSAITVDTNGQNVTYGSGLASSNNGGLTKTGAGKLVLTGTNAYTGATTISAGTVDVQGSIATGSATTVNSGGTLQGTGSVGAVEVQSGGTLAPGDAASIPGATQSLNVNATLTLNGNLTVDAGATLSYNLYHLTADTGTHGSIAGGTLLALNLTSGVFDVTGIVTIDLNNTASSGDIGRPNAYNLVEFASTNLPLGNVTADFNVVNLGGGLNPSNSATLQVVNLSGGGQALQLDVVPEPSTYALFLLGLGFLGLVVRRRAHLGRRA